jgi:cAMP-specific phosphodiesterase 4
MHTSWLFLADSTLRQRLLEDLDCLSLLIASLTHDLDHPGTTNAFQVNTGTSLALRYNDASVLENHHCAQAFAALGRTRLLASLSAPDFKYLRCEVVAAILATDMSAHKTLLASVSARMAGESPAGAAQAAAAVAHDAAGRLSVDLGVTPGGFERYQPEHRMLLISFLLHCADLCNPLLPPAVSQRIAGALGTEFEAQAARERAAGLPVTVMLASDRASKAKQELGFIGACVLRCVPACLGVHAVLACMGVCTHLCALLLSQMLTIPSLPPALLRTLQTTWCARSS